VKQTVGFLTVLFIVCSEKKMHITLTPVIEHILKTLKVPQHSVRFVFLDFLSIQLMMI